MSSGAPAKLGQTWRAAASAEDPEPARALMGERSAPSSSYDATAVLYGPARRRAPPGPGRALKPVRADAPRGRTSCSRARASRRLGIWRPDLRRRARVSAGARCAAARDVPGRRVRSAFARLPGSERGYRGRTRPHAAVQVGAERRSGARQARAPARARVDEAGGGRSPAAPVKPCGSTAKAITRSAVPPPQAQRVGPRGSRTPSARVRLLARVDTAPVRYKTHRERDCRSPEASRSRRSSPNTRRARRRHVE